MGGGEEPKVGFSMHNHWSRKTVNYFALQKVAHCTCQAETVVSSSFTTSIALSVRLSGTVHPTVDSHELTRSQT